MMAEQHAELIFLLHHLSLEVGHASRGICHLRLELPDVELRDQSLLEASLGETQRFAARFERAAGDVEVEVELAQLEIRRGDVADEREHDGALRLLRREQIFTRSLGGATQTSPEVELPGYVAGHREDVECDRRS